MTNAREVLHKPDMTQTFQEAVAAVTSPRESLSERLARVKVLLGSMENAMFDMASGGGVKSYRVNTGQTVIDVEVSDLSSLRIQYRELLALYNELCGIYSGGNVMVMRDATTSMR